MMKTNFITATAVRSLLHGFYTYKTNKLGEADFIKDGPKYHMYYYTESINYIYPQT